MGRLTVVDVGHGSCTVIESDGEVCVVDAPQRGGVKRFLASRRLRKLKYVVESHGHTDHAWGLMNLVTDKSLEVEKFLVNPEHKRGTSGLPTPFERRMSAALTVGRKRGSSIVTAVTSDAVGTFQVGELSVSVLWPTGPAAYAGLGGVSEFGAYTSNSLSVVMRVESRTGFSVLVPGDLDLIGLNSLLVEMPDLKADIVIAPHHGGLMGSKQETARAWRRISDEIGPREVLVSVGREQEANPRAEIVDALSAQTGEAPILRCTQLSRRCGDPKSFGSVSPVWSEGDRRGVCCAGSIVVDLEAGRVLFGDEHYDRVHSLRAPNKPVCGPLLPPVVGPTMDGSEADPLEDQNS